MKKILFFAILPLVNFAQIPSGYYDGTTGLTGYTLKSKVHDIISKKVYSYAYDDLKTLHGITDLDKYYENDNTLLDIYSEKPNAADAYNYDLSNIISSASAEGLGWNREHGMPQSTFYGIYPMYSDMHYIIPADARINQLRSNYPYARNNGAANDCNSPNTTPCTATNGSKLGKSTTPGYTNTVYEPIDEFKGDVARYLLYYVVRYEGHLGNNNYLLSTSPLDGNEERGFEDWYINLLKDWNALDPVSQRELDRNNAVYAIQNVRNPFIDHPEWVDMIWNVTPDAIAPSAPLGLSASNIGESFVTLNWNSNAEADLLGYKIYVNGEFYKNSKTNSVTVDRLSPSTSYDFTVKAYDNGYLLSSDSNVFNASTLSTDNLAKDLMITKYIEGSSNNKAIEVTNLTGHDVDLSNYYLRIQLKGTSYYFSDAYELEGKLNSGQSIVIINPYATLSNYSISQANFITNSPPLTYTGSQYVELAYGKKYLKTVSTNNYDMGFETVDGVGLSDVSNANGNMSLYRNTNIKDPNLSFTMTEWTGYSSNYATGLGTFLATSESIVKGLNLSIYPNPTSNLLYVKGEGLNRISKAEIYDFTGKLIMKLDKPFTVDNFIDVSALSYGNYILKLDEESIKFIKK